MEEKQKTIGEPEVRFCDICQESIPDQEFSRGQSLELKGRLICHRCRRRLVPPLPSAGLAAFLALLTLVGIGWAGWRLQGLAGNYQGLAEDVSGLADKVEKTRSDQKDLVQAQTNGVLQLRKALLSMEGSRLKIARDQLGLLRTMREGLDLTFKHTDSGIQGLVKRLDRLAGTADLSRKEVAVVRGLVEALERRLTGLETTRRADPAPTTPPATPGQPGQPAQPTPPAASPELTRLAGQLGHAEPDERWKAIEGLEKLGGQQAADLVARALEDTDIWVRRLAAEVLGRMGDKGNLDRLIKALGDSESMVRGAAIASLRKLTGQSFDYNPMESAARRREAIQRWEQWLTARQREGKSG